MVAQIPGFRTEQEMREFWDTHDSAEYFEDMGDDEVILDIEEVGGLVNEAEHFVDEITRDIVHWAFTGLVDAGGYRMRWIEGAGCGRLQAHYLLAGDAV